ncbi:unnamed protein product, partial [Oikopleura dioica]
NAAFDLYRGTPNASEYLTRYSFARSKFRIVHNNLHHHFKRKLTESFMIKLYKPKLNEQVKFLKVSEKIKRSRVPDIIGIGFAKCGTGALAFLDCHPSESVLDDIIAANETGNLEALRRHRKIYASRLPHAADDELLIEKSPQYAGGKDYIRKKRALAMKIINPNVKLVAIVCDPVKRAYSQLRMKARRTAVTGFHFVFSLVLRVFLSTD